MTRAFKQGFMDKLARLDPGFMAAMQDIAAHGTPAVTVATPPPVSTNATSTAVSAPAAVASNDKKPVVDETKFKPEDLKLEEKPSVVDSLLGEGPSPGVARAAIPFLQNLDRFRSFDDAKMLAKNFVKNPSFSWTWEF